MLDHVPNQPKKLSFNFVEAAGVRCFHTMEFSNLYEAIHAELLESGVELSVEEIADLAGVLPDSADDVSLELTLIFYLIDKKLLTKAHVGGEGWNRIFPSQEEVEQTKDEASAALAADPELRARLELMLSQMAD